MGFFFLYIFSAEKIDGYLMVRIWGGFHLLKRCLSRNKGQPFERNKCQRHINLGGYYVTINLIP